MAITITIDEADFLDMLVDRVKDWTDNPNTIELFEEYYDHLVYSGYFEGSSRSIAEIVDNDYCNNTSIVTEEEYNKAREEHIKDSVDNDGFSDDDRPKAEDYDEDDDSFEADLKDFEVEKAECLQQYEEDIPTWEDLEVGEIPSESSDFLDGYYIEAKTDTAILVSY